MAKWGWVKAEVDDLLINGALRSIRTSCIKDSDGVSIAETPCFAVMRGDFAIAVCGPNHVLFG